MRLSENSLHRCETGPYHYMCAIAAVHGHQKDLLFAEFSNRYQCTVDDDYRKNTNASHFAWRYLSASCSWNMEGLGAAALESGYRWTCSSKQKSRDVSPIKHPAKRLLRSRCPYRHQKRSSQRGAQNSHRKRRIGCYAACRHYEPGTAEQMLKSGYTWRMPAVQVENNLNLSARLGPFAGERSLSAIWKSAQNIILWAWWSSWPFETCFTIWNKTWPRVGRLIGLGPTYWWRVARISLRTNGIQIMKDTPWLLTMLLRSKRKEKATYISMVFTRKHRYMQSVDVLLKTSSLLRPVPTSGDGNGPQPLDRITIIYSGWEIPKEVRPEHFTNDLQLYIW